MDTGCTGRPRPEGVDMRRSIKARSAAALLACALATGGLAPVALAQQDLRMPDTRDAADSYQPALQPAPSTGGIDWVSAAIGAAAGTGTVIVAVALGGGVRRLRPVNHRP